MNYYYRDFRKKFGLRFLIGSASYTIFIILIYFLFKVTLKERVYYGYEFMYPFYHWANLNRPFTIFLVLFTGYFFIGLLLFNRSLKYMDEIIRAVDDIHSNEDELIFLSGDLKHVTEKMNHVKFSLRDKAKAAEDAEKRKNDLIIYLAHDLKTPLTSIIGYLTILKEENDLSEGFRKKYLQICYDRTLRLEDLINEFFDITRYSLNDLILEKSIVDFNLMMEQIIFEFQPLLIKKDLKITSHIEANIKLSIDSNKIERVIDNIIRNAINYSYEKGEIQVHVRRDEGLVKIVVINKGPTIPSAKLEHIFDEFFRLDSSRSSKTGGVGLGLAIAKSIVLAHQGSIEAKSEDELTEMTIKLPS